MTGRQAPSQFKPETRPNNPSCSWRRVPEAPNHRLRRRRAQGLGAASPGALVSPACPWVEAPGELT